MAREKGLEPLAKFLWDQQPGPMPLAQYAAMFEGAASPEEARGEKAPVLMVKNHGIGVDT